MNYVRWIKDVFKWRGIQCWLKFVFSMKATKLKKSSPSIWHLLHNVVKISSIFVAFLENMNFKRPKNYKPFNFPRPYFRRYFYQIHQIECNNVLSLKTREFCLLPCQLPVFCLRFASVRGNFGTNFPQYLIFRLISASIEKYTKTF